MRTKRIKLTAGDYRSMELVSRQFKASGLRKEMNEDMNRYYKSITDRKAAK